MSTTLQRSSFLIAALLGATVMSAASCSPHQDASAPSETKEKREPASIEQMFPLDDRTVSNFNMSTDLGDEGILVLEIFRPRPEVAELKIAGRVQRLSVEENRISQASGGILLEEPLEEGRTFKGPFGTVTITATDELIKVPAGTYAGCLTTVEESTSPPKRSTSTYCPGIGLVKMQVESFGDEAGLVATELTYHGPRVELPKRTPPRQ